MCRISFFTTLDLYKAYFRGYHRREYKGEHIQKVTSALFSQKEATTSFAPWGFVTKCFLILIVDEVKNFATNIRFLKSMMIKLGFPEVWVDRVMSYVYTSSFSIRINGKAYGNIMPTKGI